MTTMLSRRLAAAAAGLVLMAWGMPSQAAPIETSADHAIIVDYDTGTVLMEKLPDEPVHPASMSKLMTLYLVFEKLKHGEMKLDDTLPVSEKAWRMAGSKMFVHVG